MQRIITVIKSLLSWIIGQDFHDVYVLREMYENEVQRCMYLENELSEVRLSVVKASTAAQVNRERDAQAKALIDYVARSLPMACTINYEMRFCHRSVLTPRGFVVICNDE